ncbi:MAG TPA: hypothetical protein VE136_00405 [Anaerolineales bacterium]|nr:hypothetical protein [Anaerolineales bacterium]
MIADFCPLATILGQALRLRSGQALRLRLRVAGAFRSLGQETSAIKERTRLSASLGSQWPFTSERHHIQFLPRPSALVSIP